MTQLVRGLLSRLEYLGSELQSPIKEGREGWREERRGEWCGECQRVTLWERIDRSLKLIASQSSQINSLQFQ